MENMEKNMEYYKVEILLKTPEEAVKNGVARLSREIYEKLYLSKGNKDTKVYSYSVEPIDRDSDQYKFIRDMDK
jgi:hypothetical protein